MADFEMCHMDWNKFKSNKYNECIITFSLDFWRVETNKVPLKRKRMSGVCVKKKSVKYLDCTNSLTLRKLQEQIKTHVQQYTARTCAYL